MNLTKKLSALPLALALIVLTVTMVLASGPAHGEPAPDAGPGNSQNYEAPVEHHYFQVLAPRAL